MKQLINHIAFVLDRSYSMKNLKNKVIEVFDNQIKYLAQRSKEVDQETRVSVYIFDDTTECVVWDKDVLRLPSIKDLYIIGGNTALIDATRQVIKDLKETPQKYGDHSFLIYGLTDGENNRNSHLAATLKSEISGLPENWTFGVLVPDVNGVVEAKRFGFPANNIQVWNATTERGVEDVGETLRKSTDQFFTGRTKGTRGSKNLFQVDVVVSATAVKTQLEELSPSQYELFPVHKDRTVIKDYVESWTQQPYRVGSAYYQLTKPEKIQGHKQVCLQEKRTGKVFTGHKARQFLNLPDYEVRVSPGDFKDFDIFVQSTSANRLLYSSSKLIVLK